MQSEYRPIRVALLGAGSVGAQVARLLLENKEELAKRVGAELELVGVAVRDIKAKRSADIPQNLLTTDAESLLTGSDIVIELMGGINPAYEWIKKALNSAATTMATDTPGTPALLQPGPTIRCTALLRGSCGWSNPNH